MISSSALLWLYWKKLWRDLLYFVGSMRTVHSHFSGFFSHRVKAMFILWISPDEFFVAPKCLHRSVLSLTPLFFLLPSCACSQAHCLLLTPSLPSYPNPSIALPVSLLSDTSGRRKLWSQWHCHDNCLLPHVISKAWNSRRFSPIFALSSLRKAHSCVQF